MKINLNNRFTLGKREITQVHCFFFTVTKEARIFIRKNLPNIKHVFIKTFIVVLFVLRFLIK